MDASAITTASTITSVAAALGIVALFWGLQSSLRREMRANTADLKAEIRADRTEIRADMSDLGTELRADRTEFKAGMAELKGEVRANRTELRAEIKANRTELKGEVRANRTELRAEIKALDDRIVSLIKKIGKIDSRVHRIEGYLIGRRGEAFRRADD